MSRKSFQILYLVVVIAAFLPLVFPIFEIANKTKPIIFGFPFSFFWIILWIVIVFVAVVCLYFIDPENKNGRD